MACSRRLAATAPRLLVQRFEAFITQDKDEITAL
jgi:hypothetical protein